MGWFKDKSQTRPEMSREESLSSKLTMWQVQVNRGDNDRARQTLDEIHRLQWEIGRDGRKR